MQLRIAQVYHTLPKSSRTVHRSRCKAFISDQTFSRLRVALMSISSSSSAGDKNGSSRRDPSVVFSAVVTALLSSHAMDIGRLVMVAKDTLLGSEPKPVFQVEAGLLVLGVGFLVLLVMNARKALASGTDDDHEALTTSIIVGLIGGAFSILDKTTDSNGIPQPETFNGLFYLAILSLILLPPILALPWNQDTRNSLTKLALRLGLAALSALAFAAALMLIYAGLGQLYHCETVDGTEIRCGYLTLGSTSFFLSAPAIAVLIAPWALLAVDPVVRPDHWSIRGTRWQRGWMLSYLAAGVLLSVFYAGALYFPKHGVPQNGWMRSGPLDPITLQQTVLIFLALHLPALLGAAWCAATLKPQERRQRLIATDVRGLTVVTVIAAFAAGWVAWTISGRAGMESGNIWLFIAAHAVTAFSATAAVLIAYRWPTGEDAKAQEAAP